MNQRKFKVIATTIQEHGGEEDVMSFSRSDLEAILVPGQIVEEQGVQFNRGSLVQYDGSSYYLQEVTAGLNGTVIVLVIVSSSGLINLYTSDLVPGSSATEAEVEELIRESLKKAAGAGEDFNEMYTR